MDNADDKLNISQKRSLQVTDSLISFRRMGILSKGVLSFMTNLMTTEEEITELAEIFKKIDTSNDGFLSMDEIKVGFKEHLGDFNYTEQEWKDVMKTIDTNNDG